MADANRRVIDALLVARAQLGNQDAFEQLVARYHASLRYYVRRIVERRLDPDDLLQDVWITAYRQLGRLERPGSVRAWLYGIARYKALQSRRGGPAPQPLPEDLADPATQEDKGDLMDDVDVAQLHCALDTLSCEHRETVVLRWFEGMSYEEIAQLTGCELGTVRSRLHYAKVAIRKSLERGGT